MRIHLAVGLGLGGAALLAVSAAALAEGPVGATSPAPVAVDAGVPATASAAQANADAGAPTPPPATDAGPPELAADAATSSPAAVPPTPTEAVEQKGDAGADYTPTNVGFSFGLRTGYSIPIGTANGGSLSSVVQGVVPIGAEAGWFFNPHLYVGAYFLYGFGLNPDVSNDTCSGLGASGFPETCTATMLRMGAVVHWHFRPDTQVDPWVGGGLGYDIINLEAEDETGGTLDSSGSLHGFIVNAEGGLDFKPLPYFGLGPYAELATGHYSSDTSSTSLHAWLTFGIRLRTNL